MATKTAIQSQSGGLVTDSSDIKKVFTNFYIELYTSTCSCQKEDILSFLEGLDLPALTIENREMLDCGITAVEIKDVIWKLRAGKSPRSDGRTPLLQM